MFHFYAAGYLIITFVSGADLVKQTAGKLVTAMYEHNGKQYKVLAVCCAGVHKDDVRELVLSIMANAADNGFKVVFLNATVDLSKHDASSKGEASIYFHAANPLFDALIVLPEAIKDDEVTERIINCGKKRGIPVVSINREIKSCYSVVFNYADSFEEVVSHVIDKHGCRRINFLAGMKNNSFSDERLERFRRELDMHGITFDEKRLGYGDFWEGPAEKVVEEWLASEDELPEAIICANDLMAITACRTLKRHGLKVPDDIIVTGFDGIELEKYMSPRLTTCAADINEAGKAAVETVRSLFETGEAEKVKVVTFKLRVSQSCGCVPVDMNIVEDKIMQLNTEIVLGETHEGYMFTYLTRAIGCQKGIKLAEIMRHYCDSQTWLCIRKDYFGDKRSRRKPGDPSEIMTLFMSTELSQKQWSQEFNVAEMIPGFADALEAYSSIMLYPLHYEDEIIGYIVTAINSNTVFRDKMRFVSLTNQIIESFNNRRIIERTNEKLADMHIHDPLTGLLNRRGFYKKAASLIRHLNKTGGRAIIFSVDMDGLKYINDNYGHNEGDKAIRAVSSALLKCVGEDDIVSRFGGDEFTVLSADDDGDYVERFGERVTAMLNDYVKRAKLIYPIVVSVGYTACRFSTIEALDECIRVADEKMYEQKRAHKGSQPR